MFSRKFCWTAALLATVMFSMRAQAYPDRPLTLIVPFAAGGSADLIARLVAGPIGKELGQTLILENRAGAGGTIGAAAAAIITGSIRVQFGDYSTAWILAGLLALAAAVAALAIPRRLAPTT